MIGLRSRFYRVLRFWCIYVELCFFPGIAERAYLLCPGRSSDSGKCSNKLGKLCSLKVHGVLRCLAKWKLDEIKFVNEGRLCASP